MLLASVVGAAAASAFIYQAGEPQRRKLRADADVQEADLLKYGQRFKRSTGIYGDVSEVYELINIPDYIVKTEPGVDLQGAPFLWLHLRNGSVYRSYDTKNPKVFTSVQGR